jgi:MFS family permease
MPATGSRRLVRVLYAYAFLDEFVLLYPLYALLFIDAGLSSAEVSALFVLWSASAVALEVPSGALADATSRRALLVVAPLIGCAGWALWVTLPTFWAFAAGFVLWGARGALVSGAFEALAFEELRALGEADAYARVLGRTQVAGVTAVVLATALAAPAFAVGGYALLGAASIVAGLLTAGVALLLPEHRALPAGRHEEQDDELDDPQDAEQDDDGYVASLRAGLREVRRVPAVRGAVLLVPAVIAVWGSLEEYTSLLIRGTGVPTAQVPWWELVLWCGVAGGGLVAARAARLPAPALGVAVAVAALLLAGGASSGVTSGVVAVAVAFGLLQAVGVVVDTRLQEAVTGRARATVTSVAALATELLAILTYLAYLALAEALGDAATFALLGLAYLPVAAWVTFGADRHGPRALSQERLRA